ncbi:hypothetical protein ACMFMG_011759 [Clarireedia jacksonii]
MENSTIPVRTPHYYEKAGPNLAVSIALPILAALVVSVRIHVRRRQKMPLDIDDWLTIPALILALGAGVTMIIGIAKHGLGYPTPRESTVPPRTDLSTINSAIITTTKAEYAMLVLSTPALGCIKMSVLFFYHRIFCPSRTGPARIVIIAMMILITLWTLGFGFTCIFPCKTDFSAWWGPTKDLIKKCISPFDLLFALTLSDFITDALVLIIPLPLLWKLKLSIAKKISVSAIFLLGMVALAASLTRLVFMSIARNVGFAPGADQDRTHTPLFPSPSPSTPFPQTLIPTHHSNNNRHSLLADGRNQPRPNRRLSSHHKYPLQKPHSRLHRNRDQKRAISRALAPIDSLTRIFDVAGTAA